MATLTVTIRTGNAAMEDAYDMSLALRSVADRLANEVYGFGSLPDPNENHPVRDANGARVGEWVITS